MVASLIDSAHPERKAFRGGQCKKVVTVALVLVSAAAKAAEPPYKAGPTGQAASCDQQESDPMEGTATIHLRSLSVVSGGDAETMIADVEIAVTGSRLSATLTVQVAANGFDEAARKAMSEVHQFALEIAEAAASSA